MAGISKSKTTRATKSTSPASAAAPTPHSNSELESKIAALEAKIVALTESLKNHEAQSEVEHAKLAAKCDACCDVKAAASSGGKDLGLRAELKKYFKTVANRKVETYKPNLD
jgi:Tfp pilus assembly protein FimV